MNLTLATLPFTLQSAIPAAIEPMQGWCTVEKAAAMAALILATGPEIVVEIGVFGGRSLVPQALALNTLGRGVIYGIDPWRREANLEGENDPANDEWWAKLNIDEIHRGAVDAVWRHGLQDHAVLIRAGSQHCKGLWPDFPEAEQIDILHLDGNHSALASTRDVENYLPRLKSGGYLWFDDVNWPTTTAAQALVERACDAVHDIVTPGQHCRLYRKR